MTIASIQVISTETIDSAPLIVFTTDTERFLFNCGEGAQRLCTEHKIRLQKVESIFFTETRTESIFGLPGLCLTIADSGKKQLGVYGPAGLDKFWGSTRRFMHRPDLSVRVNAISAAGCVACRECVIHCLPLHCPSETATIATSVKVSYICESAVKTGKFDLQRALQLGIPKGPLFAKLKSGQQVTLPDGRLILPEDVVGPSEPGRCAAVVCALEPTHIEALFLQPEWKRFFTGGDSYGKLDIMIHLSSFDVVHCNESYRAWMLQFGDSTTHVFVGKGACRGISSFQASTKQARRLGKLFPSLYPRLPVEAVGYIAKSAMVEMDKDNFLPGIPLMKFNLSPKSAYGWSPKTTSTILSDLELDNDADEFLNALMETKAASVSDALYSGVCFSDLMGDMLRIQSLCCSNYMPETPSIETEAAITARYGLSTPQAALLMNNSTNEIYFLGTGCAIPSKYRNVTSILLRLTYGSILLDAGEGTWHQLMRMTESMKAVAGDPPGGRGKLKCEVVNSIKAIWISHPHADHHLGLIRVLSERKKLILAQPGVIERLEPILLIAPYSVLAFVKDYCEIDPFLNGSYIPLQSSCLDPNDRFYIFEKTVSAVSIDKKRVDSEAASGDAVIEAGQRLFNGSTDEYKQGAEYLQIVLEKMGLLSIDNAPVQHCSQAYGICLRSREGWSLVFSGDTRPCEELIQLGRGATILIHEATFDNSMEDEAIQKRHSTVGEAYGVHEKMESFRLILTHFSQRYPTIPPLFRCADAPRKCIQDTSQIRIDSAREQIDNIDAIFASDYLRLTFADLLWVPCTATLLSRAFPLSVEEEDDEDFRTTTCSCSCSSAAGTSEKSPSCTCKLLVNRSSGKMTCVEITPPQSDPFLLGDSIIVEEEASKGEEEEKKRGKRRKLIDL